MKRIISIYVAILMFILSALPINAYVANEPSRIINVVYDDSGSMYEDVNTWCWAKYSMEVFAAMLGESDKMNIYYMSDYTRGTSSGPRIVLDGKNGAEANVAKIHKQKTIAKNTPFNSVKKAYADLCHSVADEKWLVILTDGEFEDGKMTKSETDAFFANKEDSIRVMFLGMGYEAKGITEDANRDIYYDEAWTSNQILNCITEI